MGMKAHHYRQCLFAVLTLEYGLWGVSIHFYGMNRIELDDKLWNFE